METYWTSGKKFGKWQVLACDWSHPSRLHRWGGCTNLGEATESSDFPARGGSLTWSWVRRKQTTTLPRVVLSKWRSQRQIHWEEQSQLAWGRSPDWDTHQSRRRARKSTEQSRAWDRSDSLYQLSMQPHGRDWWAPHWLTVGLHKHTKWTWKVPAESQSQGRLECTPQVTHHLLAARGSFAGSGCWSTTSEQSMADHCLWRYRHVGDPWEAMCKNKVKNVSEDCSGYMPWGKEIS